jgi:hypothetical protein
VVETEGVKNANVFVDADLTLVDRAGTNHRTVRLSEALESFSLSPGEKARVRASVLSE